ncbi:L-fucose kinase-like isoform X2 [Apostichopus japonicus]
MATQNSICKWTAIAVTCSDQKFAAAVQKELEIRQRKGFIDNNTLLLTVEDPQARVGSGGATLNALLVVAEHLSQQHGFTVVNSDVLLTSRILILHLGRNYPFSSCGKAFVNLPAQRVASQTTKPDDLLTNIDFILDTISSKLSPGSPPGVWVSSTDMMLHVPDTAQIEWSGQAAGAVAFAVPASEDYAKHHGMYRINKEGYVDDIIYQGGPTAMKMCQLSSGIGEGDVGQKEVSLVSGVVFLSVRAAEKLLALHVSPPLDACTYMGLDSGVKPLQLSLFFDVLLALCSDVSEEEYISGEPCKTYDNIHRKNSSYETADAMMKQARSLIWKALHGLKMKAVVLPTASHHYLTESGSDFLRLVAMCPLKDDEGVNKRYIWNSVINSYLQGPANTADNSILMNSIIEGGIEMAAKSIVSHCHLHGPITLSKDSILNGISQEDSKVIQGLTLPPGSIIQGFNLQLGSEVDSKKAKVYITFGRMDTFQTPFQKATSSFCNSPWMVFLNRTGIDKEDVWPFHLTDYGRTLANAKLFPVWHHRHSVGLKEVIWLLQGEADADILTRWRSSWRLSLEEIMQCLDVPLELKHRRDMFCQIGTLSMTRTLEQCVSVSPVPFFKSAVIEDRAVDVLNILDKIAMETSSHGVAARTLACIADVLGAMADGKGGLRSGPAGNKRWSHSFALLEKGDRSNGVLALAAERSHWLVDPDHLLRAARHYEGAAQILIRQAVMSAREFITTQNCDLPPRDKWIVARCPARIDVSGGWSDTPPITYENGGAVVDAAILLDGKKPIGAKVKRIEEPHLVLVLGTDPSTAQRLVLTKLSDLADFTNPQAPGALLKAAFCCAEVVTFPSSTELKDQLIDRYQGGFELMTWSDLPTGSGLGTSSILAGAVIAVLWKASGKTFDNLSLIHAVLHLEQMLTTGGGWQDQVGGLMPALNIGRSEGKLPLKVTVSPIQVSKETQQTFDDHFVLVYTGKTRLARNLLQDVIRNWYGRLPQIVTNCQNLKENAEVCAKAFQEGNFEKVGDCMNIYWTQKKVMAPGCEPQLVRRMMDALLPHVYGQALAGAGGGGFMYILTKESGAVLRVKEILAGVEGTENITVHSVSLDQTGLEVTVEDDVEES